MLYFAYGSNMDVGRMTAANRAPDARFICRACLPGHRLAFTRQKNDGSGAADVLPYMTRSVWGVVYDISDPDRARLDLREGVQVGAYEPVNVTLHVDGDPTQRMHAFTYVVCNKVEGLYPTSEYLGYLIAGSRQWDLPTRYRRALKKRKTTP